jgi:hypothetical protein
MSLQYKESYMEGKPELFRVLLLSGRKVWIGVISGCPFVGHNDDATAHLLELLGFGILVKSTTSLRIDAFLEFARSHPVFSLVDWKEMGIEVER